MTTRGCGICVAVLGAAAGALPFMPWYRADLPGREVVVSGIDVKGELWSLPALACVVVAIGVFVAARVPDPATAVARRLAGVCVVAGALCLVWALWGTFRVTSVALPVDVSDGPPAPLRVQPMAFLAAAAGAAIAAVSLGWVRSGSD